MFSHGRQSVPIRFSPQKNPDDRNAVMLMSSNYPPPHPDKFTRNCRYYYFFSRKKERQGRSGNVAHSITESEALFLYITIP
jgi:hypothetical protein